MRRTFQIPLACCIVAFAAPSMLRAWGELTITVGPPPIPVYEQPMCPQDGYNWTPGYWAYGDEGYFWVPGTWLMAPAPGLLWTPGYWGWGNQSYRFHEGYWGPQVGFYGGVNYGHGYGGSGFQGGYWQGNVFFYNRAITSVGSSGFTHIYSRPVPANASHVAFNGGSGGLRAAPSAQDRKVEHERHLPPTGEQAQHHQAASQNKTLLASANHGRPPVAATVKAGGELRGAPAKAEGGQRTAPASRAEHETPSHPAPHAARPAPTQEHHAAPAQEHRAAPAQEHRAAPAQEHRAAPAQEHRAAPPQEHRAAPPQEHRAAPAQEHRAAPQQEHRAAPPQEHPSAPQEHRAAPPSRPAPEHEAHPK